MSKQKAYQATEKDLIELQSKGSVNKRIEWIRNKASEVNDGLYTVSKVANDIGVGPSVLSKLESGFTKNPNLELLQSLSNYFSVPINAFFDEYYENPIPFTIFGPRYSSLDVGPLLRPAYQVDMSYTITSLNSDSANELEGSFYLSPLDLDEFQEEIEFLLYKYQARQQRRDSQLQTLETFKNNK